MMKYNAVDLCRMNENDVWSLPDQDMIITFADGDQIVNWRSFVMTHYYWRLFKDFPGASILKSHVITDKFDANTHQTFGAKVFWHVFTGAKKQYPNLVWDMSKVFYEITNSIYNATCNRLLKYSTSASLHDIIEVLNHDRIQAAKAEYRDTVQAVQYSERPTEAAIAKVHQTTKSVLYGDTPELKHNNIKKMCVADIVSPGQMIQLIGPRGFLHDINGKVFKYPIDVGYAEGMGKLYDSAIESRSAARALFMQTDPLEQSEYFNREMQLLCSIVHSIQGDDCKNFSTVPWVVQSGQLQLLRGKYHMVDGKAVLIWDSIDELVGSVIQLRSITACGNRDTQTVCATCLGWSSTIMQPGTNIGYATVTILCAIISQLMLSTKHYEASTGSQQIEITERMSKWLRGCRHDSSKLLLQKNVVKRNPIIRLEVDSVRQLNNILSVDVSELSPSAITNCKTIGIIDTDKDGNPMGPTDDFKTMIAGQGIFLTTEVLMYLKANGWISTPKYIEFRLKDWDPEVPIFGTPRIGDNILLFLKEVKSFIMPTKESEVSITSFTSRGQAMAAFTELLQKRRQLKFNLIQVEIFVRACMTVNDGNPDNFLLPHPNQSFEFRSAKHCLYKRSLTTLLAYETQAAAISDGGWYRKAERVSHMMDPILKSA